MSRVSGDDVRNGLVHNGFDYALQVWVLNGVIQKCGHPETMKNCCNAGRLHGQKIEETAGHENRLWE